MLYFSSKNVYSFELIQIIFACDVLSITLMKVFGDLRFILIIPMKIII